MIQIDMPMPDNCVECRFNVSEFGYCNAMPVNFCGHVNDFEEDGRPEWCPLKAQEPRVLTLEEALNSLVIEYRGGKLREVGKHVFTEGFEYYGDLWRVWDKLPTDEQRERESWDDAER